MPWKEVKVGGLVGLDGGEIVGGGMFLDAVVPVLQWHDFCSGPEQPHKMRDRMCPLMREDVTVDVLPPQNLVHRDKCSILRHESSSSRSRETFVLKEHLETLPVDASRSCVDSNAALRLDKCGREGNS